MITISQPVLDASAVQMRSYHVRVHLAVAQMNAYAAQIRGIVSRFDDASVLIVALYEGEWWVMRASLGWPPTAYIGPFMTRGGAEQALDVHKLTEKLTA